LRAVGIDDWAWRKGCQYGTIICDLERRRIVALLPDRASGTSAAWLRGHPGIEFIARDRGASYADAASTGAPQAIQIADRWHLFENASASFLDVVRQNMHAIRKSSATDSIDPELLSCAERKRWESFQHRKKTVDAVLQLVERGTPLKQITRRLSLARQTVRRIARGGGMEVFRSRVSILEPHAETLDALWTGGCRNGAELWRRLRTQGFQGSLRVVSEWATRRRLDESSNPVGRVRKTPSARKIARLMTIERDQVPKDHASIMAKIEHDLPPLLVARDLVDRFHEIMRQQKAADLGQWIAAAIDSPLSSFAKGIIADCDAVKAAILHSWSNGQTEGQITKLKLVKRQMYGRAKLDLLEARLIGAA
jgi:transposase